MTESGESKRRSLDGHQDALHSAVREALNSADPIHLIAIGAPEDEYDPEVATILPRLGEAYGVEDVGRIIHEEFVRWFTAEIAGPIERYTPAAPAVWLAWSHRLDEPDVRSTT